MGGWNPTWLELAFLGRPDFQSRGPKILILKLFGICGRKIGAPQKRQIQPRRIHSRPFARSVTCEMFVFWCLGTTPAQKVPAIVFHQVRLLALERKQAKSPAFVTIRQENALPNQFSNSLTGSFGKGSLQKHFCKSPRNIRRSSAKLSVETPSLTTS